MSGFTAAARALGISASGVSRAIARLESRLGTQAVDDHRAILGVPYRIGDDAIFGRGFVERGGEQVTKIGDVEMAAHLLGGGRDRLPGSRDVVLGRVRTGQLGEEHRAAFASGLVHGDGILGSLEDGAAGVVIGRITESLTGKMGIDSAAADAAAAATAPYVVAFLREHIGG